MLSRTYSTHCDVTEGITVYPVASEISVKWAVNSCAQLLFYRNYCHYSQYNLNHYISLPFQRTITTKTTMKVTNDTVTISGLGLTGGAVQLKDADPNELQLFIERMLASVKGESVKYNFSKLCLVLVLE